MKKALSLILALVMLIGMIPMTAFAADEESSVSVQNPFADKTVSILSHSMSTYAGVSNSTAANSTIGSNDIYYTEGRLGVYQKDTWWQQVIDALDMELLVNNSWSGSCVFMPRKGEASVGYGDRAVNLHNDHTGEEPDVIFVYLGCNDFAYYKDTFGKADDVNYASLIHDNGDGTFSYVAPKTTCEAYAIMLHKVENRYPDAEVYCMTSTARRETDYTGDSYPDAGQPTEYTAELQKVAKYFNNPVIDLENAIPKDVEIFDKYIGDKRAHANALGMDQITNEVLSVMLGKDAEIFHVTSEDGTVQEQAVLHGGSYNAEVELREGYSVVVTMGGEEITDKVYQSGKININDVTGDIVVCSKIQRDPLAFRWEIQDDALVSVGDTDNAVSKLAGTVANGVLNNTRYQLETAVVLKHDLPWEVEWQFAGNWRGCLFTSDPVQSTKDMVYLSRTVGGQLSFGTWTGAQYDNYGVDLSYLDDQVHTYRLVNRIAVDGSNMVWMYVDGEEIGPMNHYYIGSKDQGKTSDWISGKDFVFSYISMEGHALKDCQLDYLQVQECVHTYENGICTGCGDEDPNGLSLDGLNVLCLGDSITYGQGLTSATRWSNVLASKYDWNLTNKSQGGISLSSYYYTTNGKSDVSIAKKAEVLKTMNTKPDAIIVWGGHNDTSYRASPLGTWEDNTTDSFKGALKHIAELANEYAPDATLFVLTPLWNNEKPSTLKVPENTTDTNWMFVDAIYEGAEKYGWIPINMDLCGITPFTKSGLLLDNIHPNEAGTEKIVEYLSEELASYGQRSRNETIIFNQSSVSVKPGESTTLKAVLSPRSGNGSPVFTWSSSDTSVATVDANGKVVAITPGTAVVTATAANGISAGISVSVECNHSYESTITAPTCTEQGYTTYTCACGDSYVDDYVDAVAHNYSGTVCTVCGDNLAGKTVSILGDSISTFSGVSNNANSNSTIGSNATYYSGQGGITRADTWWQQTIDVLDMELLVNNYWSGSCVFQPRKGETSVGYTDRCVNLHNDHTGEEPDVILVFLGTNDYKSQGDTIGTEADVNYDAIITDNGDGTYTYATAATTCEAYAIMLHKMSVRYPNADIYCMSLLPRKNGPASLTKFNQDIAVMAERFGCSFVDLEHCGITPDAASMEKYMYDGKVHPNNEGMDLMSQAVVSALTGKNTIIRDIEMVLTNVAADNNEHACIDGESFSTKLTSINPKEKISVTITMDGEDITASAYNNGNIFIENVTGDVKVVASSERGDITFRWDYSNGELVNTVNGEYAANALVKQRGSANNGVFEDTYYRTQHMVKLLHDKPWTLEWRGSGSGGFMLSDATSAASSTVYFRRHTTGYLHVFGMYDGSKYNHYGVKPGDHGIDVTVVHTYRMENRINADGTNMVYLFVDGVEIGAMNNYYVGYVSQGTTDNWISGKDFCINYIGSSSHPLNAYAMEYLEIYEDKNGPVIITQPADGEAKLGERYMVEVKAEGEGLKYQWYFRNAGTAQWYKSSVRDNTYDDVMTTVRAGREVYCVITDANGNSVTTEIAKLIRVAAEELAITQQPTNGEAVLGERYCVTVEAKGEGLKYQWYFRNAGSDKWCKSSVRDNTYDDVMTTARAGREVYCVITDALGNTVTTDVVTLIRVPVKLEIISQPKDATAAFGEMFCATVVAKGDGVKYQWYFRNAGTDTWYTSGVRDNTYDDVMTKARNGREIYCVITDMWGNSVTTDTVKLIAVPSVELKLLGVSYESAAMGENYCATVNAQGEGLTYQWYFRNAGSKIWYKSSIKDNTYDDVMTKARANREVYCVITDAFGNQVTTEVVTLQVGKG